MAHGPRFWPRPASATTPPPCSHAATGKPRAHARRSASSDGEAVLYPTAKRFTAGAKSPVASFADAIYSVAITNEYNIFWGVRTSWVASG